jgi:hypothetical protein
MRRALAAGRRGGRVLLTAAGLALAIILYLIVLTRGAIL